MGMNRLHHLLIGDLGNLLDLFIRDHGSAYVKWWWDFPVDNMLEE